MSEIQPAGEVIEMKSGEGMANGGRGIDGRHFPLSRPGRTGQIRLVADSLVVNEIYPSLQGESTFAGLPCVFVRLTACNLRCSYCDTAYAFGEGTRMPVASVLAEVRRLAENLHSGEKEGATGGTKEAAVGIGRLPLMELTGGEPLLQPAALPLMASLCDEGFTVLLETSGALDITKVDPRVRRIVDLKCPGSGESSRNRWENLTDLRGTDEVKFVIGTREDYEWAKEQLREHGLARVCPVLFSWVTPLQPHQRHASLKAVPDGLTPITRQELVEWIIADGLPVRFQLQMHKFIWPPDRRGV
jgi:7-carboxy-7-deazaguanine synthase